VGYGSSLPTAYGITTGDFNRDGKLDFAVADVNGNAVSVFSGNGDGTFQNPVSYTVQSGPQAIVAADLNGDGRPDIITASGANNTVDVLLGEQTISATATGVSVSGAGNHSVAAQYQGDNNYAGSESTTVSLVGLSALTMQASFSASSIQLNGTASGLSQ
jgi:FG-GAP-like repeat